MYRLLVLLSFFAFELSAQDLFEDDCFQGASCALIVKDAAGETLKAHQEQLLLQPASVLKLLTTAKALEQLGADYCVRTYLYYQGVISSGVLEGDVVVRGAGDPSFVSPGFSTNNPCDYWAGQIAREGVKTIRGKLVVDLSAWGREQLPLEWQWGDVGNYYGAAFSGLNYLENTYRLSLQSAGQGRRVRVVGVEPDVEDLSFHCSAIAAPITWDGAYILGGNLSRERMVVGRIPENQSCFVIKGSMACPGMVFLHHFREALERKGVAVHGELELRYESYPHPLTPWLFHDSPPLSALVEYTNTQSHNLFAEALGYLSCEEQYPDRQEAVEALQCYWQEVLSASSSQLHLSDACGLSRCNLITAEVLSKCLVYMLKSQEREAFLAGFPIAGESGTVRHFLSNTPLQGQVLVKSGSMEGVRCYAGYLKKYGRHYPFVVMVNHFVSSGRACQEAIEKELKRIYSELDL